MSQHQEPALVPICPARERDPDPGVKRVPKLFMRLKPNNPAFPAHVAEVKGGQAIEPPVALPMDPVVGGQAQDEGQGLDPVVEQVPDLPLMPKPGTEKVPPRSMPTLEWSLPRPLNQKVAQEPYPLDALPPAVRAAVEEVQGFVQAPGALVASSALGAMSLAIQAQVDMKRAENLTGPVGLYLLAIAESGERKTSCDKIFFRAIRHYEAHQAEIAGPTLKAHKSALGSLDAKASGIKAGITAAAKAGKDTRDLETALAELELAKPEEPRVPRLIYGDVTPEKLKWDLANGWPSAGVVTSEAGTFLGAHGMGHGSIMRTLSVFSELWEGADLPTDRRSSVSFTVRGARLTIALQVQAATLRKFLKASGELALGNGFLARFLVAWPESTQGSRAFTDAPTTWPHLEAFNLRMTSILKQPVDINVCGGLTPAMLTFTPEAKAAWVAFHDRIERELADGGKYREVQDVAAKAADNAARISGLFHVFENHPGPAVAVESLLAASRIAEWHLGEARRFLSELALPSGLEDAARLDSWLIAYCKPWNREASPENLDSPILNTGDADFPFPVGSSQAL
jgi:putative DNA primase/helicase